MIGKANQALFGLVVVDRDTGLSLYVDLSATRRQWSQANRQAAHYEI